MIYAAAEYFTALVEAIMFYMLLDTFCEKREMVPKYVYYLSVGVLMGLIILVNQNLNYTAYNIVGVVFSTFVISFLFSGPVAIKAIVSILGFTLASVVELAVMFFIAWVYGLDSRVVVEEPHLRLLGIIFSKMLAFTLVNLICKIVNSAVKSNSKFLHTTKSDKQNHGLGIENIRSALSKYKNVCKFKQTDSEFILSFVIFEN